MDIKELLSFTPEDLAAMDGLMHQLSERSSCREEQLRAVVDDPNSHLYVARAEDGRILGCATLCISNTPEFRIGGVEAVVVSDECRGTGLGRRLMEHLLAEARTMDLHHIHLTSNPKRVAANALYRSLGFELYETNFYKLKLR